MLDRLDVRQLMEYAESSRPRGGLLDEPVEDLVDNVFEIGEKAISRVPGWRFVESAVIPDETVLELSCNRTYAVDILVVAAQKTAKEIWWFVKSCSPLL